MTANTIATMILVGMVGLLVGVIIGLLFTIRVGKESIKALDSMHDVLEMANNYYSDLLNMLEDIESVVRELRE